MNLLCESFILDASSERQRLLQTGFFIRTIGSDSDCGADTDDFCNGALKANTEYT